MERKQRFEIFYSTLLKSSIFIYTIIVLLSIIIYTKYYINILIKLLFTLYIFGIESVNLMSMHILLVVNLLIK